MDLQELIFLNGQASPGPWSCTKNPFSDRAITDLYQHELFIFPYENQDEANLVVYVRNQLPEIIQFLQNTQDENDGLKAENEKLLEEIRDLEGKIACLESEQAGDSRY